MKNKTIAYTDSRVHAKSQERTSSSARRCAGMRADIISRVPAGVFLTLALLLPCAPTLAAPAPTSASASASASVEPYRVLVMHSFRNSLPVNTDWYKGIVRGFSSASDRRIEIDIEAPDLARFNDAGYVSNLFDIYRHKYRDQKPHLIIPTYTPAFDFMLKHGEELFPGIPIVFCGADRQFVASQKLAEHITGVTTHLDIAGTLELVLQVHPGTRRVAVIVGSGRMGKLFELDARQALQPFDDRLEFLWLQGLPIDELTEAVSTLPEQTVILYLVQLQDRTGKTYTPINTLKVLSPAANAPIYGLWDTLLGYGLTGGRLETIEDDGFHAAQMGMRILRGEAPAAVPVFDWQQNKAIFHGSELVRWNIDEQRLPEDSRIVDRQRSVWEEYGTEITIAGLVLVLQSFLVIALSLNRRRLKLTKVVLQDECERRAKMETLTLTQQRRLARFSKERTLGALATGIAHEINQPLIAIQNYAQAAKRRLHNDPSQTVKLNELFDKIEQQSGRAGDIIQRIRTLVTGDDAELRPVSLYSLLDEVTRIVGAEIEEQGCRIDCKPCPDLPEVLADELQIQLVLANLLQNAAHSMQSLEDKSDKLILIEIDPINEREVQVSVADRGPGIPPDRLEDIFEPYSSDNAGGMGIGLAVCMGIIEAHGGRLRCNPNPTGGTIFQFTLRVAEA